MIENGTTLFNNTDWFTAFPDPQNVFASDVEKHLQYFLPLASVDLSKINPLWVDTVHFIVPIEPADGVMGDTTEEFHSYYSKDNWIGFSNDAGRYVFEGDWRLFVRDTIPDYYQAALDGYEVAKKHFNEYGALHIMRRKPNKDGEMFDFKHPRALVKQLGGECHDANWANMGNFKISRFGNWIDTDHTGSHDRKKIRPETEDGRPFEYIGLVNSSYYNMSRDTRYTWAETLLFYDPISRMTLTTFDWT